jgi:hypothetical protein
MTVSLEAVWQHELATMTGVTTENINRQPRSWHARGLVSIGRCYIDLIDPAALPRLRPAHRCLGEQPGPCDALAPG